MRPLGYSSVPLLLCLLALSQLSQPVLGARHLLRLSAEEQLVRAQLAAEQQAREAAEQLKDAQFQAQEEAKLAAQQRVSSGGGVPCRSAAGGAGARLGGGRHPGLRMHWRGDQSSSATLPVQHALPARCASK